MDGKRGKVLTVLFVVFFILISGGGFIMLFLSVGKLKNEEPKIVTLQEPIKMAGLETSTNTKTVFRDIPKLGRQWKRYKEEHIIPNQKKPWAFVAVSKDIHQEGGVWSWQYIMGYVVTSSNGMPEDLIQLEIPAQTYAVFTVHPKSRFDWGLAISRMKDYAVDTWMKQSPYEPSGDIGDFEYHDERSTRKENPEIDLYFPVRIKKQ